MNNPSTQLDYWDAETAELDYCEKQLSGLRYFAVLEMVDAALAKASIQPKSILEIGGGSQFVARHLSKKFPNAKITCTDVSASRVDTFVRHYGSSPHNLTVQGGIDARNMPFPDESFDLIIGDAMLHHIDFLKPALFEIHRCLQPHGRAIFVREPVVGWLGVLTYRLFQRTGNARKHIEINYFEYKRMLSQWQYEFMMAGFAVKPLKFWRNQSWAWRIRSIFPHLTPCYLGFVLDPIIDVKNLDTRPD